MYQGSRAPTNLRKYKARCSHNYQKGILELNAVALQQVGVVILLFKIIRFVF